MDTNSGSLQFMSIMWFNLALNNYVFVSLLLPKPRYCKPYDMIDIHDDLFLDFSAIEKSAKDMQLPLGILLSYTNFCVFYC